MENSHGSLFPMVDSMAVPLAKKEEKKAAGVFSG
jgi:hypothetical protein